MLAAESKVHPYRMYEYDCSLELEEAGYHLRYWRVWYSDTKNNSTSHKALSKTFKRAGLKEGNDDPLWEEDKILTKLREAWKAILEAQKKHKENSDACLRAALEQKEKAVQESDDPRSCSYGSTKCLSHMERSNE
jgi:hypothetical protein